MCAWIVQWNNYLDMLNDNTQFYRQDWKTHILKDLSNKTK